MYFYLISDFHSQKNIIQDLWPISSFIHNSSAQLIDNFGFYVAPFVSCKCLLHSSFASRVSGFSIFLDPESLVFLSHARTLFFRFLFKTLGRNHSIIPDVFSFLTNVLDLFSDSLLLSFPCSSEVLSFFSEALSFFSEIMPFLSDIVPFLFDVVLLIFDALSLFFDSLHPSLEIFSHISL